MMCLHLKASVPAGVLLEERTVVFCPNIGLLTTAVLALTTLIRPFAWQHLIMPVLPASSDNFLSVLEAPFPFIIGVQVGFQGGAPYSDGVGHEASGSGCHAFHLQAVTLHTCSALGFCGLVSQYRVCCREVLLLCLPLEPPFTADVGCRGSISMHLLALAACQVLILCLALDWANIWQLLCTLSAVCHVTAAGSTKLYGVWLMSCKGSLYAPMFAGFRVSVLSCARCMPWHWVCRCAGASWGRQRHQSSLLWRKPAGKFLPPWL